MKLLVFAVTFILLTCPAFANAFTLMVDEITDTRTTGDHFAGLKVKFNALGDDIIDAKAIKLTINEVLDDTGKSLITENTNNNDFICPEEKFSDIEIKLKNPKRKSTSLKILSGTLTIYNPQNDRYATAIIPNFSNVNGKNIINESLKKSNVDICILSKQQYEEWQSKEEEDLKQKAIAEGIVGEMLNSLTSLFSGFMTIDDNSVLMLVNDQNSKIIKMEFFDENNIRIKSKGRMSTGNNIVFQFSKKLPASAKLKIYLYTDASISISPISLKNIALP